MHRHQLQRISTRLRLVIAGLKRGVRQKCRQPGVFEQLVSNKSGRGIDQLIEVGEAVGAFALTLIMRLKTAVLDHMLH